jgi:hypothetical protein
LFCNLRKSARTICYQLEIPKVFQFGCYLAVKKDIIQPAFIFGFINYPKNPTFAKKLAYWEEKNEKDTRASRGMHDPRFLRRKKGITI